MRAQSLEELTDGRLLYLRRPPVFGFILISLTVIIISFALFWSSTTMKPSIIRASGTVEGANRTLVMSALSGKVTEVLAPSGTVVDAEAPILRLEGLDLAVEQRSLSEQRAVLENQFSLQERFTRAIKSESNDFSAEVDGEEKYFYEYKSIQDQRAQLRVDRASMEAIGYTPVEIDNAISSNRLKSQEILNTALTASTEKESAIRAQMEEISIRLTALQMGQSAYTVTAAASGAIHLDDTVKVGTVVGAGEPIGAVADLEDGLRLKAYVAVPDRQLIAVGDGARVAVSGLPAVGYQKVNGKVAEIDTDVTTLTTPATAVGTGGASYFVVDIELENDFVESFSGERHKLVNGTAVDVELVYQEVSFLEHFGHLLGLR